MAQIAAASGIQIPSWGAKCPRSALDSRRCCSAAQIQSWSVMLMIYNNLLGFSTTRINPSWGVKKARTTFAGTPGSNSSSGTTDWANLGDGPVGHIAELVLARDVADYVRFRAVCRPWRRCSLDPRLQGCLDSRFHPRKWIMLDKAFAGPRLRRFLNVSTGECIRMDLPALEEHTLLSLTPEGLLLLLHEDSLAVRLLNPLTLQITDLPPLTALLTTELQIGRRFGRRIGKSIRVYGVGTDASAVAVSLYSPMALVVAKPGDERWTLVDNRFFRSSLTFAGRFYCATCSGVMVLDGSTDQQQPPSLLMAVDWSRSLYFYAMADSLHLVDNGGDLMLVHRMLRRLNDDEHERKYEVYKVDLDAGVLIPAKSFGGRAVFMGLCRALSVSGKAFPLIAADTLYLGSDCYDRAASYNLADGTTWELWEQDTHADCDEIADAADCHEIADRTTWERWEEDTDAADCDEVDDGNTELCYQFERMQPPNIVDCLSYCIRGSGRELA